MKSIRICLAGAPGWAGSALSRGIFEAPDMELVAGVSRSHAGQVLGEVIGIKRLTTPVFATATEALHTRPDVFVEYTRADVAKSHILSALRNGAHVVVGTSGLGEDDYREINNVANEVKRGVLAAGNFALTAVLLQKFSEIAAKYISHWEIIDYAHSGKKDAPSGTAKKLGEIVANMRGYTKTVSGREGISPRQAGELEITALRAGGVPGIHDLIVAGPYEMLRIEHTAFSRNVLAQGAVHAAEWLIKQKEPKVYSMADVLGLS